MKISVQLSPNDYIRARRLAMRPRPSLCILGYVVLVLFAAFIVWQGREAFVLGKPQRDLWIIVGITIYVLAIYFVFIPWQTKRIYRQQKTLQQPLELELDEGHFSVSSAHGTFKMAWRDFHKWKKNSHLILVYQSSVLMHMIPLRAFQSRDDCDALVAILKKNLGAEKA